MGRTNLAAPLWSGLFLAACSSTAPKETPNPGEKLLWSNADKRYEWTYKEAVAEGDRVAFVAVSDKYATERYAREDAEQSVRKKAVQFAGTRVKTMVQNMVDEVGKASQTINPDRVQKEYEKQVSETAISQLKSKAWYLEKWQDVKGAVYWKAFLMADMPKSVLDQAMAEVLNAQESLLKTQMDQESDPAKKAAIEKMLKAFEEMEKKGFSVDK